jgi:iron uptake system component EfeO
VKERARRPRQCLLAACVLAGAACGPADDAPSTPKDDPQAPQATKERIVAAIAGDLDALVQAATELHDSAPLPSGRGWDAALDADAIAKMKQAWIRGHEAYEHIEAITEVLVPDLHGVVDGRYEEFLTSGDRERDPFDSRIVVGFHAVERILWSDSVPEKVSEFERNLAIGFEPRFPATADQARDFKNKLSNQVLGAATVFRDQLPPRIDVGRVLAGLVAFLQEQKADVNRSAFGQDESRYAQRSLSDLRAGLSGARRIYLAYRPWLLARPGGRDLDVEIVTGLDALAAAYAATEGDAMPPSPPRWKPLHPSDDDLTTPFGRLFSAIAAASQTGTPRSLAFELNLAAGALGLPLYPEDPS